MRGLNVVMVGRSEPALKYVVVVELTLHHMQQDF
jgi:hypothetical protein